MNSEEKTKHGVEILKSLLENVDINALPVFKTGGSLIPRYKKGGSGIHIKKANRGKFTEYCGGKVTSECIAKGKRSSNPAVRKRATFAQNSRRWHKK